MLDHQKIKEIINQFGANSQIRKIAQYLEDEYLIPYETAVKLIYDAVDT